LDDAHLQREACRHRAECRLARAGGDDARKVRLLPLDSFVEPGREEAIDWRTLPLARREVAGDGGQHAGARRPCSSGGEDSGSWASFLRLQVLHKAVPLLISVGPSLL
jgi:hypothetical protein